MFSSAAHKQQQQSSKSPLPQINEDDESKPAVMAPLSLKNGVVRVMQFKKLFDGAFKNMTDDSLDHSSSSDRQDDTDETFNNKFPSTTKAAVSFGSRSSHEEKKGKKKSSKNNIERWAQNQQLNLQGDSSTRWMDKDDK